MIVKIRAKVFGSLRPGTIDIHVGYDYGMIDSGSLWTFDTREVPEDCRFPNTYLWITTEYRKVLKIERMTDEEIEQNRSE